ncbi:MAG: glucosidase [Parachlamydiales bacterium]|jgi:hypothetical protein
MSANSSTNVEKSRLIEAKNESLLWKLWGPYLSERQWGTVREDYSEDGNAWAYFSHDQARSRAYRWGEDGIAGISDDKQNLCFALALWNGQDSILKERHFGLTNQEGNHGEDVKEYYYYLDSTPTHSYMKYLYKYPQNAYPYSQLVTENSKRSRTEKEFELIDTGIFNENKYFDVYIEYAKEGPEDILVKINAFNRGKEPASLHLLPTLWFRNTWTYGKDVTKPTLKRFEGKGSTVIASMEKLGDYFLYCEGDAPLLFTENETNNERLFGTANNSSFVKDGINDYVIHGNKGAVNAEEIGSKVSPHYLLSIQGGGSASVKLRLRKGEGQIDALLGADFDRIFEVRLKEADEFYNAMSIGMDSDKKRVLRQAMAGMLWSKQYYLFEVDKWLRERQADPFSLPSKESRNKEWFHMINDHIISMPDKWEYPWYAAWDLAFHSIALSQVDIDFAKEQLSLMLKEIYLHPNGQIPAYEWNFSDVNPPVHAWATLFLMRSEMGMTGKVDYDFLKRAFNKLMLNFNWWVNRKDRFGKNVFEGGFLGLDNIGVFDRSSSLPTGGNLEQADGTAWMALFSQNMLELSIELTAVDPAYEDLAIKYEEHFLWIASALNRMGQEGMWDEEDGFYYDLLRQPDGTSTRLKVRSIVGLLPLCATTVIEKWQIERVSRLKTKFRKRLLQMPELLKTVQHSSSDRTGYADRSIIALVNEERLKRILATLLDEKEFLSEYGIRALSKYHQEHPYVFNTEGTEYRVEYLPGESDSGMFGGNSNWRGPLWIPINVLIIRALMQFYLYYGDTLKVECPTGSGKMMNLFEVGHELVNRLIKIFLRDEEGKRAVFGSTETFQKDEFWRDNLLFYEYFNGDTGAGLGASHQTGWTGLIGKLIVYMGNLDPIQFLERGKNEAFKVNISK